MTGMEGLFPGIEYFGASTYDGIRLKLPPKSNGIRISLSSTCPEILNLHSVVVRDEEGKRLDLTGTDFDVAISSCYKDDSEQFGAVAASNGRGIHTNREHNPWLVISSERVVLSSVEINNRTDEFGRRSGTLCVDASIAGVWVPQYSHAGIQRWEDLLAKISKYVTPSDLAGAIRMRNYAGMRGRAIEDILRETELAPASALKELDWTAALLDIYGEPGAVDVALLSALFAGVLSRGLMIGPLSIARRILNTPEKLIESERLINKTLQDAGIPSGFIYTRHGLRRSLLLSRSSEYLELAKDIIDTLDGHGIESFISYGTLLGAIRDGDFIAHDDDVDVVYIGNTPDVSDAGERKRVIDILVGAGFRVEQQASTLNVNVSKGDGTLFVDLFPSWTDVNSIYLYMDNMEIRPVARDLIVPVKSLDFKGGQFPSPYDCEGFLQERYGKGWNVSDRFYEWPYPLSANLQ